MASYNLEIKASARKDLARLQPAIASRIVEAIEILADEPYPAGSRKLKGFDFRYRIRVGDYRVIYEIRNSILTVYIIRIGHRKDIYR
jgi:mRNA interferase RelE/StbE